MIKKTILFDLDGVLNTYEGKYDKDYIPPIKDGALELIKELSKEYKIVIFTSRTSLIASKWVIENGLEEYIDNVTNVKELNQIADVGKDVLVLQNQFHVMMI